MVYTMTTGASYGEYLETQRVIRTTGRRIEAVIHSSMMSLATSQAKAMTELGTRINDRLVQVDEALLAQNDRLSLMQGTLRTMNHAIANSFEHVYGRLGSIEGRLNNIERSVDRIENSTANPERTKAYERFRRAQTFYSRGEKARAFEAVQSAIDNDGGQPFDDIPAFQLFKAHLHMYGAAEHIDPEKARKALFAAVNLVSKPTEKRPIYIDLGHAAYAARKPAVALKFFEAAAEINPSATVHFDAARAALHAEKPISTRRHLRAALELDWNILITASADPDCIAHADIVEPMLRNFADAKKAEIQKGLCALRDILRDTVANLDYTRKRLESVGAGRIANIARFEDGQRERMPTEDEIAEIERLATASDIGLLDFRPALGRINSRQDKLGYHVIELAFFITYNPWLKTWEGLEMFADDVSKGRHYQKLGLSVGRRMEVPPQIEPSGLSGLFGISTSKQRLRDAEIESINKKNESRLLAMKSGIEKMENSILPAMRELHKLTFETLTRYKTARETLVEFLGGFNDERFKTDPF